jgi:hypothetical protein
MHFLTNSEKSKNEPKTTAAQKAPQARSANREEWRENRGAVPIFPMTSGCSATQHPDFLRRCHFFLYKDIDFVYEGFPLGQGKKILRPLRFVFWP